MQKLSEIKAGSRNNCGKRIEGKPTTLLGNGAIRREKRGEDGVKPMTLLGNKAIRRVDLGGGWLTMKLMVLRFQSPEVERRSFVMIS